MAAEVVLNRNLRRALAADTLDEELIGNLIAEASPKAYASMKRHSRTRLARPWDTLAAQCFKDSADSADSADLERLDQLLDGVHLVLALPFEVDLWQVQNLYFHCLEQTRFRADRSGEWRAAFDNLGDRLSMRLRNWNQPMLRKLAE